MTENKSGEYGNIKSNQRLEYLQLHIESRNDIENGAKIEKIQQYKPELSWEMYSSQISSKQHEQYSRKPEFELNNQQSSQIKEIKNEDAGLSEHIFTGLQQNQKFKELQENTVKHDQFKNGIQEIKERGQQMQSKDKIHYDQKQYNTNQRQIQILYNKELSNTIYLKTQVQQLLRLTAFSLLLEEQKQVKSRIYQINTQIRKEKIRSISNKRIERDRKDQINYKNVFKIEELKRSIRDTKQKTNKLGTRLTLIDNYLKINETTAHRGRKLHRRSSSEYEALSPSPIASFDTYKSRGSRQKSSSKKKVKFSQLSSTPHEMYFSTKAFPQSYKQQESSSLLLKQYIEILKQGIQDQRQYINKRMEVLNREKMNLKRQIESIKLSIVKLDNENRRFRATSGNSLRRISRPQRHGRQLSSTKFSKSPQLSRNSYQEKSELMKSIKNENIWSESNKIYKSRQYLPQNLQDQQYFDQNKSKTQKMGPCYFKTHGQNDSQLQSRRMDRSKNTISQDIRNQYFNS